MDWPKQCAAVIPCFNEAGTISGLIPAVRQHLPRAIVLDDGSTDATVEVAREAGAETVSHPQNQGKGAALKTAFRHALDQGFSWVLTLDGDGQHAPGDIPAFLQCAAQKQAAMVIGNRMGNAAAMPWLRRAVNRWTSRRLSRLAGRELPDTQCGFRLVRLEAWSRMTLTTHHFEFESELLLGFLQAGLGVEFVPVQTIYNSHRSRIHPVYDSWRWLRWWVNHRNRSA